MLPSRYAAFVSTTFAEDGSNARPLFKLDFGPFMEAKGYNGQVRIDGDWLIIERKGLGRLGHSKGDKRIALGQITAAQMRPAGRLANGFIYFSTPGRDELRGGLSAARTDDNAVIFTRNHQAEFDAIRERLERYVAEASAAAVPAAPLDPAEQIRKFAELRDEGVLSEEEFQAKKSDLLGL